MFVVTVAIACATLLAAGLAGALEPPNQHDPCSTAGRDTCGTTGVGFYSTYRYGIRWFGDYRSGVPGEGRMFCIDLGYWYPSPKYGYALDETPGLRNSAGRAVPLVNQQKMAYALWAYGRSTDPDRQAAVMLYVHSLMGDARPGEVEATAINPSVAAINRTVARDAARLHGPYRIEGRLAGPLKAGQPAGATVRVLSASGVAVPNVSLSFAATGAAGVPRAATTGARAVARISFRPIAAEGVTISVKSGDLPSTLPHVFRPTTKAAAPNAQRLVAPASEEIEGTVTGTVARGRIAVATNAVPTQLVAGRVVRDKVAISGATPGWHANVSVTIHGPFPTDTQTNCSRKVWEGHFGAQGPGSYTTPVASVARPGWYVFQLTVPGDDSNIGFRTRCDDPAERFFVQAEPKLTTLVSSDSVAPGTPVFDRVTVSSLAGSSVTAIVDLFGPFSSRSAISCDGTPVWSGSVAATKNGSYRTESFTPTVPGVYTYRARIGSTDLVRGSQSVCGEDTETTMVAATPKVVTRVSSAQTKPGSQITDQVEVSGSGALALTIKVELFGPFASQTGISCSSAPLWTGTVSTKGDGTYTTEPVTLARVGYYTFRESVLESPTNSAFTGKCGETAETTLASGQPTVTTLVSDSVVRPGSALSDRILVSGLGKTEAAIQVRLYGPFATKAAIRCTGKPYWAGRVTAQGDGELRSPAVRITTAGFYTFHETLVGRDHVAGVTTECAQDAETSLGAPAIITGRGDHTRASGVRGRGPDAPVRVTVASLGIDASVVAAGIDLAQGVLGVPADIRKLGWWIDGATPAAPSGSVVIAGHVDSATAGAGAFFNLKRAQRGTLVEVTTADGRRKAYRVVSVQTMAKAQLPTGIWSQKGRNHLVLVTCGGPFNSAVGHYRDNVVVTAVPV